MLLPAELSSGADVLDADDLRELGEKLAHPDRATRTAENEAFAERFTAEHESTFDRLSQ